MTNEQLNETICGIENTGEYSVKGLSEHGKAFPYIGWYWREVDFDKPFVLGDCGSFIGFMENNKWGYPQWLVTLEQATEIKRQLLELAVTPTDEALQAFHDYIQTCTPKDYKGYEAAMEETERYFAELRNR